MSDNVDTSAEAVEAARMAIAGGRAGSKEIALLGALERERDEARAGRELTFSALARISRARCEAPYGFNLPLASWSGSDWFTAVMGELGEAANVAKKLNRARDGIVGNQGVSVAELHRRLAEELADTVIYLDLLAQRYNINLGHAVASKFNATSRKLGITHRLPGPPEESEPADTDLAPDGQPWGTRGSCWVGQTKHYRSYYHYSLD